MLTTWNSKNHNQMSCKRSISFNLFFNKILYVRLNARTILQVTKEFVISNMKIIHNFYYTFVERVIMILQSWQKFTIDIVRHHNFDFKFKLSRDAIQKSSYVYVALVRVKIDVEQETFVKTNFVHSFDFVQKNHRRRFRRLRNCYEMMITIIDLRCWIWRISNIWVRKNKALYKDETRNINKDYFIII